MSVVQLAEHLIDQLVADVMRLEKTGGSDVAALLRVRAMLNRELLERDTMEVTAAALGRLKTSSSAKRLLNILGYCSEHFEVGDQMLSVVAVPVSVSLHGVNTRAFNLRKGEREPLKTLARKMAEAVGARQVAFDTRFYRGPDLFHLKARDMRAFLMTLADGTLYPAGGPPEVELTAQPEGAWQLIYFLGVEVIRAAKYPSLNDWHSQMQSRAWLDEPSAAVECTDEILFNADVFATAQCHGVFYLNRALEAGARGHRALKITDMYKALGVDGSGLSIYLTSDSGLKRQVRTLMVSPLLVLEHKWDLFQDETMREFQSEIERIGHELQPEFAPTCIDWLDQEEYAAQAKKHQVPLFRIVKDST